MSETFLETFELLPAQKWMLELPQGFQSGHDVAYLQGGLGCVEGSTKIDLWDGGSIAIKDFEGGYIKAWDGSGFVKKWATRPREYKKADLFTVKTACLKEITVTARHRFLTKDGWKCTDHLRVGASVLCVEEPYLKPSALVEVLEHTCLHILLSTIWGICQSTLFSSGANWIQTAQDYECDYFACCRLCDEPLPSAQGIVQDVLQQQGDALEHSQNWCNMGDQVSESNDNRLCQCESRHAMLDYDLQTVPRLDDRELFYVEQSISELLSLISLQLCLFLYYFFLEMLAPLLFRPFPNLFDIYPLHAPLTQTLHEGIITSIEYKKTDIYYDLHVPDLNNYVAHGFVNHNSGKTLPGAFGCLLLCQELCEEVHELTGLVCAPSYQMLRDATIPTYRELLMKFGLEEGEDYTFNRTHMRMIFHCWKDATLLFRSLDNPLSVRSINAGFAHIDEASMLKTQKHLLEVIGRVRQKGLRVYRIFVTSNPESRRGWMADMFDTPFKIVKIKDSRTGADLEVCFRKRRASTTDNPHLQASYIEMLRQSYPEDMYKVFVLGEDCDLTRGLVVNNFSEHNIRTLSFREELPLHVSCDFNFDPCCWVFVQRVEGEYHVIDELCLEKTDIDEMCRALIAKFPKEKIKHGIVINGDSSAGFNHIGVTVEERAKDERNSLYTKMVNLLRAEYGYHNVKVATNKGNPAISRRIESFKAKVCNANGDIFVYLDPKCERTIKCLQSLRFKEGTNELDLPSPAQIAKDPNQKWYSDHQFDALSYMIDYYDPLKVETMKRKRFESPTLTFDI